MGTIYKRPLSKYWWIRYVKAGKTIFESSRSTRKKDARALLIKREGQVQNGLPVGPRIDKLTWEEAVEDVLNDYRTNGKRSLDHVERRLDKHLTPYFGGWKMVAISTADVRKYIVARQTAVDGRPGAANATVNRELAILKRAFNLAVQGGKILHKPYVPMLRESNVRTGFFEADQLASVLNHLPTYLRPIIQTAAITGWRINSELKPLEWRHIDMAAGEIRLPPEMSKNGRGRIFVMTAALRTILESQWQVHQDLAKSGRIVPFVFVRAGRRVGRFTKAWKNACRAAGLPGKIPHDLRRTAVRAFVRNGIPERVAMSLSGHKTRSVFDRYDIVSGSDLKDAARKLDTAAGQ